MSGAKVQLYVYDMSKGLAAQLSPIFLGKDWLDCFIDHQFAHVV